MSLSNFTKYCACHEKWISWLILDTNETLFTLRRATCVIVQTHQILRLPRKMTVQNLKEICWKRMKRHFQCAADPRMIRAWSENDPTMIRAWSDHETVSPQPASHPRLLFTPTTSILYWKIQHFALRLSFQISPNTAPATKSDTWTSPNTAPATKSDTWSDLTELFLDWAMTWLSYDFTELLLDWAIYYLTELLLDWAMTWLSYYFTITWLSYYLTLLLLNSSITWLYYYLTLLLLGSTIT